MYSDNSFILDVELETLKKSLLDQSQPQSKKQLESATLHHKHSKIHDIKNNITADKQFENQQIQALEAQQYLKLLTCQKKFLSDKKRQKLLLINQSLKVEQQDYRYLLMVASQSNHRMLSNPGYYDRLVEMIPTYPPTMFIGIEKDIPRTLMNEHPFQSALRSILCAYAIRNPNLLYCQGMNYVVSYLLINNIPEEETFWVLVALIQNVLPDDFFKDLSTISITAQIFSDLLPLMFPELHDEMKEIGLDSSLFTVGWYVCLFTKGFINSVSAYLLTKLVLQSNQYDVGYLLLKYSLGIISTILGRDEPLTFQREFSSFRDKLELSVFEITLHQIQHGIQCVEVNQENYKKLEKYYRSKKQQRQIAAVEKDLLNKKFTLPACQVKYPICLHRIEISRKVNNIEEAQISKSAIPIMSQYIDDYFEKQPDLSQHSTVVTSADECVILRPNHICAEEVKGENHLKLEDKLQKRIALRNEESFALQLLEKQGENYFEVKNQEEVSCSMERKSRFEKMDDKFAEISGFFVIDEKFGFNEEVLSDDEGERKRNKKTDVRKPFSSRNLEEDCKNREFNLQKELQGLKIQSEQSLQLSQQPEKDQDNKQTEQKQCSQLHDQEDCHEGNFASRSKEKFMNYFGKTYFGKTWKKVLKIKEEQLN